MRGLPFDKNGTLSAVFGITCAPAWQIPTDVDGAMILAFENAFWIIDSRL
jgi:hypothetical protein